MDSSKLLSHSFYPTFQIVINEIIRKLISCKKKMIKIKSKTKKNNLSTYSRMAKLGPNKCTGQIKIKYNLYIINFTFLQQFFSLKMLSSCNNFPRRFLFFIPFSIILLLFFMRNSEGYSQDETRLLVIYTGGTIGMRPNEQDVYAPKSGYLGAVMNKNPILNDENCQKKHYKKINGNKPHCLSPLRKSDKRIAYWIIEYSPLLDSSDMSFKEWIQIAEDIGKHYNDYDGFVVLHGTDTMSYTASALSFMLENLGKPVVVTGSQIPISQARSDGYENILDALITAGTLDIPEVTVVFKNKLYRGNRSMKIDNHGLDAFDSPNLPPLAALDINIKVNEEHIFRNGAIAEFKVHGKLDPNVVLLRIFPSMPIEAVRALLATNIKGVVIQSYGSGNVPTKNSEILAEIEKAVQRGCLVVNVSQCIKGCVSAEYENGKALSDIGVISGSDMTPEAALTKLAYVLAKDEWTDNAKKAEMMSTNLAGEMMTPKNSLTSDDFVGKLSMFLAGKEHPDVVDVLMGSLAGYAAFNNDVDNLEKLQRNGVNLHAKDKQNGRTPLKISVTAGSLNAVDYLLRQGANVHRENDDILVAAVKAQRNSAKIKIIELIRKAGGKLHLDSEKISYELFMAILSEDKEIISAWHAAGADLSAPNYNGDTPLHLAAQKGFIGICAVLLEKDANPFKKDKSGRTPRSLGIEQVMVAKNEEERKKYREIVSIIESAEKKWTKMEEEGGNAIGGTSAEEEGKKKRRKKKKGGGKKLERNESGSGQN